MQQFFFVFFVLAGVAMYPTGFDFCYCHVIERFDHSVFAQ
jgi:hypothetical protein